MKDFAVIIIKNNNKSNVITLNICKVLKFHRSVCSYCREATKIWVNVSHSTFTFESTRIAEIRFSFCGRSCLIALYFYLSPFLCLSCDASIIFLFFLV